jgi:hypothetical protein
MIFLNHSDNPAGVTVEQDTSKPGEPVRIYTPSRRGHIYVTPEEALEVWRGLGFWVLQTADKETLDSVRAGVLEWAAKQKGQS